ncbi:autotransporter outer membrane beta-barrel domain-containing protein, partial [Helicobacter sp. 12S02634-8]|uniref:autotransporter outer membrane beta-barrel domain-containing protein n=1 Tax=Helicobacter sp. 12S02634-8 TaxID=1476199 RepID=UPI00117B96C4
HRLTSTTFAPRTLKVDTINGANGVFRLMADMQNGQTDKIEAGALNAMEFIQIYQNPSMIALNPPHTNMVVASATTEAIGADFKGIATIIGLYDYLPLLEKRPAGGGGSEWILSKIERTPNQTAKSLFNILSLPYQIFRLQADSLHTRIQDFIYPPTLNGAWAKISGGGIYAKQPLGSKTTQDLFYNFQGGYDYGESSESERYFYGGSVSYTHLNAMDAGFKGSASAIGLGAYGGYIHQDGWVLDGSVRYVYAPIKASLNQADRTSNFGSHMFLMGGRAGFRFYPFHQYRSKVIERCVQEVFCRNAHINVAIRDDSTYLEPFISLDSGIILGNQFSFVDKQSQSIVQSQLDWTPALITKLGLQGVKRLDYELSSLRLKALIDYSMDLNLGGKVTLVDLAGVPLYNNPNHMDHRLGLGVGVDWLSFNDSLSLHTDFKTEFFGKLNTYWLLSAGLRYKFGQAYKTHRQLNYRPLPKRNPAPQSQRIKNRLKPYEPALQKTPDSFYENNHFKPTSRPPQSSNTQTSPSAPNNSNSPIQSNRTSPRQSMQESQIQKASPVSKNREFEATRRHYQRSRVR